MTKADRELYKFILDAPYATCNRINNLPDDAPELQRIAQHRLSSVAALQAVPASGEGGMQEALKKCRDRFTEYAREHQRKAQAATHPRDHDERMEKANRNLDMATVCIAALKASGEE